MDRPDPRTGQHGVSRFRDHRQIDRDRVALGYAMAFQDICETTDLIVQLLVSDFPGFVGIVTLPDDRRLVTARGQMPIDTVHRHVGGAVLEPFDRDLTGVETGVLHLCERLDPVYAFAVITPKLLRRRDGERVHLLVLRRIRMRALTPTRRHGMDQRAF